MTYSIYLLKDSVLIIELFLRHIELTISPNYKIHINNKSVS